MAGVSRAIFTVWAAVFALGSAAFAVTSLGLEFRSAPYRSLASRLEAREPVPAADIDARLAGSSDVNGALSCRPDLVHANLVLHLTSIDRTAMQRNDPALEAALQRGRTAVLGALECQPADGNAWARLAMITGAQTKSVQTLDRPMALSALFAPGEMPVLLTRLSFWTSWPFVPPGPAVAALNRDIETAATWLKPQDAAQVLGAMPPYAGAQVRAAVARQTDQRQADLARAGLVR